MSLPEDVLKILTLRCEEASELTSHELDEPLRLSERIAVRGHMLVCRSCRRLRRQLQFLRAALNPPEPAGDDAGSAPNGLSLSADARVRIEQALLQAARDHDEPGDPV